MSCFAKFWNAVAPAAMVLTLAAVSGCPRAEPAPAPVVILAAASTKDLLQEIVSTHQQMAGSPPLLVQISSGPSQSLAQQVLSGAPADIYVSAHAQWANEVQSAGLAAESVPWISNQLVLVAPKSSEISQLSDLLSPQVERVAIAGQRVPAGEYAEQALRANRLWDDLVARDKILRGHDVRTVLTYAARHEVDAAIVYASDAKTAAHLKVVARFDSSSHEPIVYHLVRLGTQRPASQADRVFQWLQGEPALRIARQHGFHAPRSSGPRE